MIHFVCTRSGLLKYSQIIAKVPKITSAIDLSDNTPEYINIINTVITDANCERAPITAPRSGANIKSCYFVRCSVLFPMDQGESEEVSDCFYSSSMTLNNNYIGVMRNNNIYNNEKYNLPYCEAIYYLRCSIRNSCKRICLALAFYLLR